jgi:hypothetical protein
MSVNLQYLSFNVKKISQGSGASEEIAKEQAAKNMIDILTNFQTKGEHIFLQFLNNVNFINILSQFYYRYCISINNPFQI